MPKEVLPPDARLRAPARRLPAKTVDCHAHLFDHFEKYAFAAERKYQPPLSSREAWLALHAALGVERGVQVHGSPYGFDNSITEDFLRAHGGRFLGIAAVPRSIETHQLKKLDEAGFRGARLMDQFATGATTADLETIAAKIAPFGWHLEINIADCEDWVALEPRLERCPVPVVFDHLGRPRGGKGLDQPGFKAVRRMLSKRDDRWTKISSFYRLSDAGPPGFADMKPFVQALLSDRPDRCVWGTNWPHPGLTQFMPNDADLLDLLESWLPNDNVREPLFSANAAHLYRFDRTTHART